LILRDIDADKKLIERLEKAIKEDRVSHAYLFQAAAFSNKLGFAKAFIKAIICDENPGTGCNTCVSCRKVDHDNLEDLIYIEKNDKGNITVNEIERLQEALAKKPLGKRNFAVIVDADSMNEKAQNKLLKTLEEPSVGSVLILLSENQENLLPTIRSRCAKYSLNQNFGSEFDDLIGKAEKLVSMISERKPLYEFTSELESIEEAEETKNENAFKLLDAMEVIYGDMACGRRERKINKEEIFKAVAAIEEARKDLKLNIKSDHVFKRVFLKIGG